MVRTITADDIRSYTGLSTDNKPVNAPFGVIDPGEEKSVAHVGGGSTFFEIDTCDLYMFNEVSDNWIKLDKSKVTYCIR